MTVDTDLRGPRRAFPTTHASVIEAAASADEEVRRRAFGALPIGILSGLVIAALFALPFALGKDPATGNQYFWEIMIPGSIVGLIVGSATQRFGRPSSAKT